MSKHYVADIILEAKTPLRFGSGTNSIAMDMPVQRDWNDLPMILGSSIAGVLRAKYDETEANKLFGYQKEKKEEGVASSIIISEEEVASSIIVSNALLVGDKKKVCEALSTDIANDAIYQYFMDLPLRQHTAIDHRGTAKKGSKYDEEIIYKGSRFKCRIELESESKDEFTKMLEHFQKPFLLGGGSSKGFGRVEAISIHCALLDLDAIPFSLNDELKDAIEIQSFADDTATYTLTLKPESFFMFGSGFGDEKGDVDSTAVYEYEIDYPTKSRSERKLLIPATSIKGAVAHRVAYHANEAAGIYADEIALSDFDNHLGENNPIVSALFGHKKEKKNGTESGRRGYVRIEDAYLKNYNTKVFDHNSIDRFTGGVIDGALFAEETTSVEQIILHIEMDDRIEKSVELNGRTIDPKVILESALKDVCTGMLPLGGMTTKGHGVFDGKLEKGDEIIVDRLSEVEV